MLDSNNINYILAIIAVLSVVFNVYNYFRKPQEDQDKQLALAEKEIGGKATVLSQKEAESKAALLAQAVQLEREQNDRRFKDMSENMDKAMTLAQNHIHTVDTKVDALDKRVSDMNNNISNELIRLSTIISERIPQKRV